MGRRFPAAWWTLFPALLACREPPAAEAYADAARVAGQDMDRALSACKGLDGDLRWECEALAAHDAAAAGRPEALAACGRVEEGLWRDECAFLVADAHLGAGRTADGRAACAGAGRFAGNCFAHAWKAHAFDCLEAQAATASTCYAPARAWTEGTGAWVRDIDERFWQVFFDATTTTRRDPDRVGQVDRAVCDAYDRELRSTCRRALTVTLQRALNRAEQAADGARLDRSALCGGEASLDERVLAATGIGYAPDADTTRVALAFEARICRRRERLPE